MATVGNVNEVLEGHVVLDLECLDRVYLNAYVPTLQVGGQVVTFFSRHRDRPIASPRLFRQMGEGLPPGRGRVRRAQPHAGAALRPARPPDRQDPPLLRGV